MASPWYTILHDTKATLPSSYTSWTSANYRRVCLGCKPRPTDESGTYHVIFLADAITNRVPLILTRSNSPKHWDRKYCMKKDTTKTPDSPIGENTVLTLTIPMSVHKKAYGTSLQRIAGVVTVPGFRKGKAPTNLVETQVGPAKILDQVLEDVLPEIYAQAVKKAGIVPLVQPHLEVKELPPEGDWTIQASTAVAPKIVLGDWKKIATSAGKEFSPQKATEGSEGEEKKPTAEEVDQQKLSFVFGKIIESINPKIAPLLLEHETRRQIEEFARHLASHRMELDQYLQATGKTVETLQQEYAASSVATLQLEFVLDAITSEMDPKPTEKEIEELLGKEVEKLPPKEKKRYEEEALRILKRRSVISSIKELSK